MHAPIHIDTHASRIRPNDLAVLVPVPIGLPGVCVSIWVRDWDKVEVLARGRRVATKRCEGQRETGAYEVIKEFVQRVWFRLID